MSLTNGHSSEADADLLKPSLQPQRSESDLSETNDIPTTTLSPDAPQDGVHSDDDAIHDMATSELDEDEDAPGEEDADFDEVTPPPEQADAAHRAPSLSESSSRSGKRKAEEVDDEAYMKQNPELYGLRRSVRVDGLHRTFSPLTCCLQGRAKPARRVVRAHPWTSTLHHTDCLDRSTAPMKRKMMKTTSTPAGGGNAKRSLLVALVCSQCSCGPLAYRKVLIHMHSVCS